MTNSVVKAYLKMASLLCAILPKAPSKNDLSEISDDKKQNIIEEYQALVRALRRKEGFGLFFVEASPRKAREILLDLKRDFKIDQPLTIPLKRIVEVSIKREDNGLLQGEEFKPGRLPQSISQPRKILNKSVGDNILPYTDSLFETLEKLAEESQRKKEKIDIFWIEGLEKSLLGYEDVQRLAGWDEFDLKTYSWKGVPPILSHLNLGRERFEAKFNCTLVFVVPIFVVKYLSQRAGDFFDWKSGFFEFPDDRHISAEKVISDGSYNEYSNLDAEERLEKILHIKDLLDEQEIEVDERFLLLNKMGLLFELGKDYKQAEISYDRAAQLKHYSNAGRLNFTDRANNEYLKLNVLKRSEEINQIKELLASEMDDNLRSELLLKIADLFKARQDYEQAEIYYGRAVQSNPYLGGAWTGRTEVLSNLGRYDEALKASLLQRLFQGDGLLPESQVNLLEVVGILESYGHVIDDYQINLRYIAGQQFLVLFPFFKYMNGNVSFKRLLQHWQHNRINYEFSEYCMKSMMYHGGGGVDAYLDTPEFIELASRAIEAKTKNNFLIQGFNKISPEFLTEQVRQMCYYRVLGQFWNIMADIFLALATRFHKGEINTIRDVIHHVKDGLLSVASEPIYYSVEIKGEIYDLIPKSVGLIFLVDAAIPYLESVFFRSLPFMGLLSYNAQAQQLPADQGEFTYGALYADPIPAGSAGIPPSLLARDMTRYMPEYLMAHYRTFSRGESDLSVKSIASFQKSMFCVTSAVMLGLAPYPLDSTDLKAIMENREHFEAWIDRLINSGSRLEAIQTS